MSFSWSKRKRANDEIPPLVNKRTRSGRTAGVTRSLGADGTYYLPGDHRPSPPAPMQPESFLPTIKAGSANQEAVPEHDKRTRETVFQEIVKRYRPLEDESPAAYAQIHWTTSPIGFKPRFEQMLDEMILIAVNENRTIDAGKLCDVQNAFYSKSGFKSIFQSWVSFLRHGKGHPEFVLQYLEIGQARQQCMTRIQRLGKCLRNQANVIGFEEIPEDMNAALYGKHIIEDTRQVKEGLRSGFLRDATSEKPANYVVVDDSWHRICAPGPGCDKAVSILFYKKSHPNDTDVTSEKIFGGCIYHPEMASWLLSAEEECNEADKERNQELLTRKTPLNRKRVDAGGRMTKGPGAHSVYGVPYRVKLPEEDAIYGENNIRVPEDWIDQYVKSRQEILHQAFIPELASKRMEAAVDCGLINELGFPDLSSFATVGYCGTSHTDLDVCPTVGQCTHRPSNMARKTSNFFYTRFKLILEMSPNMFWYWDGRTCEHGTTPGEDVLKNNPKFTRKYINDRMDESQWTRVSTLSKAVANSQRS